jgi:hypothetical protein
MSFDKFFYTKDNIIYLYFSLNLLNENKLSVICQYIYDNFFSKNDDKFKLKKVFPN